MVLSSVAEEGEVGDEAMANLGGTLYADATRRVLRVSLLPARLHTFVTSRTHNDPTRSFTERP